MDYNRMDPKTANLDPKLREAYERIMGTAVPAPTQTPGSPAAKSTQTLPPQAPKLQVQEVKPEPLNVPIAQPPPPLPPQPKVKLSEMVQSPESPSFNPAKNPFIDPLPPPSDILNNNSPKKKSKLRSIFLTLGGLIFFVIYGVIWAKVFNLF